MAIRTAQRTSLNERTKHSAQYLNNDARERQRRMNAPMVRNASQNELPNLCAVHAVIERTLLLLEQTQSAEVQVSDAKY